MMSREELAARVAEMRRLQTYYFKTKRQEDLKAAKAAEYRIDQDVRRILNQQLPEPGLFDKGHPDVF